MIVDQHLVANVADPRPDRLQQRIERAWYRHHLRRALTILRRDFNPGSVEVFECTLRGVLVEDLARERGASPQSIYKVQQRLRRRLRELLDWRFEAERDGRDAGRLAPSLHCAPASPANAAELAVPLSRRLRSSARH